MYNVVKCIYVKLCNIVDNKINRILVCVSVWGILFFFSLGDPCLCFSLVVPFSFCVSVWGNMFVFHSEDPCLCFSLEYPCLCFSVRILCVF